MAVDVVLGGCFLYVFEDGGAVRNRLRRFPGLEVVAEGMHVAVRSDARVAKQVPGATHGLATFEDDITRARAFPLQVTRSADAGQAGTDNDDVKIFTEHPLIVACRVLD